MDFILFILIMFPFVFFVTWLNRMAKKRDKIDEYTRNSESSLKVTDHDGNDIIDVSGVSEEVLDKLPNEIKEKISHGDVKITDTSTKKTTTYKNGEKISEEETNSSKTIEKKAIKICSNCGSSIDSDVDKCIYCGTKIN